MKYKGILFIAGSLIVGFGLGSLYTSHQYEEKIVNNYLVAQQEDAELDTDEFWTVEDTMSEGGHTVVCNSCGEVLNEYSLKEFEQHMIQHAQKDETASYTLK